MEAARLWLSTVAHSMASVPLRRGIWPVAILSEALGVSRSGFYAWLSRRPSGGTKWSFASTTG